MTPGSERGSTTRRMPQPRYERLLVERGHARRRWENFPADGLTLKDLDRTEILRTRELAIQQNRIMLCISSHLRTTGYKRRSQRGHTWDLLRHRVEYNKLIKKGEKHA